ncbi:MAG: [FeFe] hydrogenase H-cluster radical SAM maturase HydE [Clostridia bacterium]|nr:[FeFe] hydrogenase H-cluster radical SAM maturase HydE [Clostridia bacterium]
MEYTLVNKLEKEGDLSDSELKTLLETDEYDKALFESADRVRRARYGDAVYIRGLIEFTNYCKNNCYYCGIRRDNRCAERYRLTKEHILACCREGYALGFRTFVLQGGEDPYFTDERVCEIVSAIREAYPDCAITLSIGEKSKESYEKYFKAGANRYLLRHETANDAHYRTLHPAELSPEERKSCLYALKEIGYQVGSGFMVGSPGQTTENLIEDLRFLQKLSPDMIGIGPYITHAQTPFANEKSGTLEMTLRLVAVLRLMFPWALLPSTTALGTIHPEGRELGLKAGANVVMPNLSPSDVRALYTLYDNKIHSGAEAAQSVNDLRTRVQNAGYRVVVDAGHVKR